MNLKAKQERRNDLVEEMKKLVSDAKQEKRDLSSQETNDFNSKKEELEQLDKEINEEVRSEGEIKMDKKEMERRELEQRESKMFVDYIRSVVENRAADTNLGLGASGAIVPTTIAEKVIAKAYDMSSVLKDATHYNTKGKLSIPVYDESTNAITMAYKDEFQDLTASSGKFISIDLGNFLAGALVKIGKSLINNTDIDVENKIIELMAEAIARFEEKEILNGGSKVTGLKDVTLGITAAAQNAITADELIKLKNKVKKGFRKNAKFIMSNDTLTAIELLKDKQDRYLFREDANGEFNGYLLGYPVEVSDNMPEMGAGKVAIYFGDMSGIALKQRDDAIELELLKELYAPQHAVGVAAWLEFDAKVENKQKIAKITMHA